MENNLTSGKITVPTVFNSEGTVLLLYDYCRDAMHRVSTQRLWHFVIQLNQDGIALGDAIRKY